jgi:hypothetical protein
VARIAGAVNRSIELSEALVNAAKFAAVRSRNQPTAMEPDGRANYLIFKPYSWQNFFAVKQLQETPANSYMV